MSKTELIRGRFHPDLHPVLRVQFTGPRCDSVSPTWVDEDGDEIGWGCTRPAGHTGRHFEWEWEGKTQKVHVWTGDA